MKLKHEPGPPMDLANMRRQGVRNLVAYCLYDSCRHQAVIDVSSYPGDTPVPWFRTKVKCAKCSARGNKIDVRPNWKEKPAMRSLPVRSAFCSPGRTRVLSVITLRHDRLLAPELAYRHAQLGGNVRCRRAQRPFQVSGMVVKSSSGNPIWNCFVFSRSSAL